MTLTSTASAPLLQPTIFEEGGEYFTYKGIMTTAQASGRPRVVGKPAREANLARVKARGLQSPADAALRLPSTSEGSELAAARAEAASYKQQVLALGRHNRHLVLEVHRLQQAAAGVDYNEIAPNEAAEAVRSTSLEWPAPASQLIEISRKYDELKGEYKAQARLVSEFRARSAELERRTAEAAEAAASMELVRAELMPMVAQLKKCHAEDLERAPHARKKHVHPLTCMACALHARTGSTPRTSSGTTPRGCAPR